MLSSSQLMSDSESPDSFFSALDILSTAAVAAYADRDNHRAPTYADDSILICSVPETPCSSSSTPSAIIPAVVSPLMEQTLDPLSGSGTSSRPVRNTKSVVRRRRLMGAKITSDDYDEEKQGGFDGKECTDDEDINPIFVRRTSIGSDDGKGSDGSSEITVPVEVQRLDFLEVLKSISKKPAERFEDSDILEIAAMKGIHFPPPRWWKPGGYDAQNDQRCEMG